MNKYKEVVIQSYSDYFNYLKNELITLHIENYFYGLIIISLLVFILEVLFPWRKNQPIIRKDFWLDTFYMFFNFFLLNLIVLIALNNVTAQLFNDFLGLSKDVFEHLSLIALIFFIFRKSYYFRSLRNFDRLFIYKRNFNHF